MRHECAGREHNLFRFVGNDSCRDPIVQVWIQSDDPGTDGIRRLLLLQKADYSESVPQASLGLRTGPGCVRRPSRNDIYVSFASDDRHDSVAKDVAQRSDDLAKRRSLDALI